LSIGIIGTDPGVSGALCLLLEGKLVAIFDMPTIETPGKKKLTFDKDGMPVEKIGKKHDIDPQGLRRVMANWRDHAKSSLTLYSEKMWSRPGQSVTSMDKLMFGSGLVIGVAVGLGFQVKLIAPATWKAQLGVSANKKSSLDLARDLAQDEPDNSKWTKMFTRVKDNGRAEAYLIAKYGNKQENS
jgi:crossover junction endodeoxyribonuclease RuvC